MSHSFLARLAHDGGLAWSRRLEVSSWEDARGVAISADGTVAVTGVAMDPHVGHVYAFVRAFDAAGNVRWTWSHPSYDRPVSFSGGGIAADPDGGWWVAGGAYRTETESLDVFVARLGASGGEIWVRTHGSLMNDFVGGVALDRAGNGYVAGDAAGDLVGRNAGGTDVFVLRFDRDGNL